MEDYTYNLVPGKEGILEAHMLEVCPTIADGPISIKVNPLSMGDREDPARLVFTAKDRSGNRYLPDRSGQPLPSDHQRGGLQEDGEAHAEAAGSNRILDSAAGISRPEQRRGSSPEAPTTQHSPTTCTAEQMGDWAAAMGIEAVYIDKDTNIRSLKNELKWNSVYYR